jgi:hypothetical protein
MKSGQADQLSGFFHTRVADFLMRSVTRCVNSMPSHDTIGTSLRTGLSAKRSTAERPAPSNLLAEPGHRFPEGCTGMQPDRLVMARFRPRHFEQGDIGEIVINDEDDGLSLGEHGRPLTGIV